MPSITSGCPEYMVLCTHAFLFSPHTHSLISKSPLNFFFWQGFPGYLWVTMFFFLTIFSSPLWVCPIPAPTGNAWLYRYSLLANSGQHHQSLSCLFSLLEATTLQTEQLEEDTLEECIQQKVRTTQLKARSRLEPEMNIFHQEYVHGAKSKVHVGEP